MNAGEEAVLSAIENGYPIVDDGFVTKLRTGKKYILVGMHSRRVHMNNRGGNSVGEYNFIGKINDETFNKLLEYIALHNTIKEL